MYFSCNVILKVVDREDCVVKRVSVLFLFLTANPVGDACISDFDGDGVPDDDDHCPHVKHLSKTSFSNHFTVDLYPGHSDPLPVWRVAKHVGL